jgi:hypothetical protein
MEIYPTRCEKIKFTLSYADEEKHERIEWKKNQEKKKIQKLRSSDVV